VNWLGLEKTRRDAPSQTGQGSDSGAVPMGRITSKSPSSSQRYS
jgi:hypothetical protein